MNPFRFIQHKYYSNLCIILVGLFCSSLYAANDQEINVNFEKTPPLKAFRSIEFSSPYRFIYNKELDLSNPLITLVKEKASIDEVLKEITVQTGLLFQRDGNNIAVKEGEKPISNSQDGVGTLSGKIVDDIGTPLPGAAIQIFPGDRYVITDNNGDFSLELPVGTYTVEISMMGFQRYRLEEVTIKKNETTPLNTFLTAATEALEEVMITARYDPETSSVEGLYRQQKNAAQLSDGISAEQIAKTPDNEVGATLKRITGVSTVDNKYVVVRSMGDRWNQAVMDGVNLPSTDAYQQHFSFDIIPTALVESVIVSKTTTPDMNASFAGGQIEIITKDIPRENFLSVGMQTSYNNRNTFKDRITKQRGKYDFFGFDDGTRDFPDLKPMDIPSSPTEAEAFLEQSRKFTEDNFTNYKANTLPSTALQISLGRSYKLKENNKWGFVAAATLLNVQESEKIDHTERGGWMNNSLLTPPSEEGYYSITNYGYKNTGVSYHYKSTLAGIFNAGLQLGKHRLSIRNTLTHLYDNELTQITGWDEYNDSPEGILDGSILPDIETTNYPVYQTFIQNKLEGDHRLGDNLRANWFVARSYAAKDTKDATLMSARQFQFGTDRENYYYAVGSSGGSDLRRDYYWNRQTDYNWEANLSWSFDWRKTRNTLKAGYFGRLENVQNQQKQVDLRYLVEGGISGRYIDIYQPPREILDGSYYQYPGGLGWQTYNWYGELFEGEAKTHAPYLMLDNRFTPWLRLVWGLRAESYVYTQIQSQRPSETYVTEQIDDKEWQYLPSANLTLSPWENLNLRMSYGKSVIRPKFAERLQVPYYDPVRGAEVLGNASGVVSTVIDNYDAKLEWFPSAGEILSLGVFQKDLEYPIEAVSYLSNNQNRKIVTMNSKSARVQGIEAEIRKNLSFMGEGKLLNNFYILANAILNRTQVVTYVTYNSTDENGLLDLDRASGEVDRPLYGQTPYAYNLGIDYTGERLGFNLFYNTSGDQYLVVGATYDAEEIRKPYSTTDAQISWKFLTDKNLQVRLSAKNLFDTPYETYNNLYSYIGKDPKEFTRPLSEIHPLNFEKLRPEASKQYDEGLDQQLYKSYRGITYQLSLTYSF